MGRKASGLASNARYSTPESLAVHFGSPLARAPRYPLAYRSTRSFAACDLPRPGFFELITPRRGLVATDPDKNAWLKLRRGPKEFAQHAHAMTAAPSIAFPTMEVPVLDDTMEMASPYQGHADDFDIDLDVMEDQVSNADKDMMGDDDYLENTHETEYDADMIDDVVEPTMVDADDHYPETSNSVEMQYNEKIYEAEMAEDDFDEDIDAHVSDFQEEANPDIPPGHVNDQDGQAVQQTQDVQEMPAIQEEQERVEGTKLATDGNNTTTVEPQIEVPVDDSVAPDHDQQEYLQPQHENHGKENVEQEREADQPETIPDTEKSQQDTNETEQVEPQEIDPATRDDSDATPKQAQGEERAHDGSQSSVDEQQDVEEKVEGKETIDNLEEVGHDTHDHASSLYPVKVYYQDNEISLFPPREGDSSETFFLEDENLAYEPFGKLLESCREVLREHIADSEVLVMDIDTLNLQLTEDSSQISKVTLYQLVDLYLRLCHNDGTDEPEPLYLTLSTKLTIAAEVSYLLVAAEEGKGLSEVLPWDGYQEAEELSPENWEEPDQEQTQDEQLQETVPPENDPQPETYDVLDENPSAPVPDEPQNDNDEQKGQGESVSASDNNGLDAGPAENKVEPNDAENNDDQEAATRETDHVEPREDGSLDEEAYDSEEQKTESTGTIAPLLGVDSVNEQQSGDQSTNIALDDHDDHDGPGGDDSCEDNPQDETDQGPAQSVTSNEAKHDVISDVNGNDDEAAERDVEGYHEDIPEENAESLHSEDEGVAVTTIDPGNDTEATLQGDDGGLAFDRAESSLENITSEQSEGQAQPSAGAPDVLGATEELQKSPVKESASGQGVENTNPSGEIQEEPEQVPSIDPSKDEPLDLTFEDDDEYLDLGLADEFNFADEEPAPESTGLASTKRPREPEDEIELAESPTPDAKRSRSS
ncbi:uncharacterized protein KD926_006108 [Aspergillus affinis]|uniref:uncharacterized protein n=1 Tax=Aspergillus affinis TaxID=1070780 RepID=UPI0022FEDFA8|nr:uncharacterized protein KD926_006108 [Aspergillus affinis]KAI9042189.1 hypothetical protein KD926_006108 [Aspergillus affinis]